MSGQRMARVGEFLAFPNCCLCFWRFHNCLTPSRYFVYLFFLFGSREYSTLFSALLHPTPTWRFSLEVKSSSIHLWFYTTAFFTLKTHFIKFLWGFLFSASKRAPSSRCRKFFIYRYGLREHQNNMLRILCESMWKR